MYACLRENTSPNFRDRPLSHPSEETAKKYFYDTNLLTIQEVEKLFPESNIYYERFLAFIKSYYIIYKK